MIQELPKGWQEVTLQEICNIKKGNSITKKDITHGKIPVIAGGQKIAYYHNVANYNDKTITVSASGAYAGFVNYFEIPIFASDCSAITIKDESVKLKYIYYLLKAQQKFIYSFQKGMAQAHVNPKDLMNLKIILSPIKSQMKIISILEKVEKVNEMRKEADELTTDFLKAVFLEMFGHPLTNSKKWKIKKMKDISKKILSGTTPKGGKEVYVEKGIVFFRSQNVWKNRLSLDDVAHIDDDTHTKMIKSSLKNKDILMTKTGRINTENSSLGRASMFLGEDNSANINGHVYLIRLQENIIPEFVLFIITTNEYREYIRSVCVGAIDKRQLNKVHLENFPIIFPPVELQNKFVSIVKKVEAMKEQQKQSRMQIHNLFNHLMQKAFKGELAC